MPSPPLGLAVSDNPRSLQTQGSCVADTIERLGFDYVNDKLVNHKIDKAAALQKTVKGGATC